MEAMQSQMEDKMLLNTLTLVDEIDHTGGATWNLRAEQPTTGYMVSVTDAEHTVPYAEFGDMDLDLYVMAYAARVADHDSLYFGAWLDGDEVVLDLSLNIQDHDEAALLANLGDQTAIYNVTTKEVENL